MLVALIPDTRDRIHRWFAAWESTTKTLRSWSNGGFGNNWYPSSFTLLEDARIALIQKGRTRTDGRLKARHAQLRACRMSFFIRLRIKN